MKIINYRILKDENGTEIKNILKKLNISRNLTAKLKNNNGIYLNGESARVRTTVCEDDLLTLYFKEYGSENIVPVNIPLDILYEDEDIIVINKPCNMPTHPSKNHYLDTLANGVLYRYRDKQYTFRAVTRLDRETSGIVLAANNAYSCELLSRQSKNNEIKKTYLALCIGKFKEEKGSVIAPIKKCSGQTIKREISDEGKYAKTNYEVISFKNNISLVRLTLETGRTHQIRVHMAHIGHPILFDFLYGEREEGKRTMLHALSVEIIHPQTNMKMLFSAPVPKDFKSYI